ncbi:MAG: DHHA1 domain-containing protein, partial [Thermoguttaceae bacterium]
ITIVLSKTPFYGEKGGQVGDCGEIIGKNFHFEVQNSQVDGNFILHVGHIKSGTVTVGDKVIAKVDDLRRQGIARAHTATHLLHYVLRRQLGSHAEQQGSKVDCDVLRFDFTNHESIDRQTIERIEEDVNTLILDNAVVVCNEMEIEAARKTGATMLFGEKYPERVRVVVMGESKELCGGTHLHTTSEVGFFKIISEESVSAGVRRITALTGNASVKRTLKNEIVLQQTAALLKVPTEEIPTRIESLLDQVKKTKKQLETASKQSKVTADELISSAQAAGASGDIKLITASLGDSNPNDLRALVDQIRNKTDKVAMLFASTPGEGKVLLLAGLSRDLVDRKINAVEFVKEIATSVGGSGGGGRPDMAQAGGKDADKIPEAFNAAKKWLANK